MRTLFHFVVGVAVALSMSFACFGQHYKQTDLVSNSSGSVPVADPQLINAWGLSRGPGSAWWVSDQATGVSTLYNGAGAQESLVVTIQPAGSAEQNTTQDTATGTIFNGSQTDFLLAPGKPAVFLFCTGDGTIAGWNPSVAVDQGAAPPSTHAVTVIKTTDGSAYTGLTSASIDGEFYLYVANFAKSRVDVYDSAFQRVNLSKPVDRGSSDGEENAQGNPFVDEKLPRGYVPFNVQAIGDDIVVTYVLHEQGSPFESDGPGLGFVDIYSPTGQLLRRLEHGDWLNAPWGVALAPLDFGRFSHDLLIGQFAGAGETQSSGYIAAYDFATGKFEGLLQDPSGKPLTINGIWAISPGNVSPGNSDASAVPAAQLYFTAGPSHGTAGLFGYLTAASAELVEGNDQ